MLRARVAAMVATHGVCGYNPKLITGKLDGADILAVQLFCLY
jgi:hypothetical protein